MKGLRTASPRTVIRPPAHKGSDAMPPRLAPRWSSLRAQKEKNSERVLGIKIEKETNMMGQRTASPRAVIPPPAHKGSDVAAPRPNPPAQMPNIFPIPNGDQGSARCSDADFS